MIARIRADVPSRSGRASPRADQSECERTAAAPALDAGALCRTDQAHPERTRGCRGAITGAPNERAEAEALAAECGARCISLAGKTALAELPALYSLAALMVTNDSGPSHFAAATGLQTIVLFGPETPRLYQPLGTSRAIYAGLACSPCVSAHEPSQDRLHRQCLHAGDQRGPGVRGGNGRVIAHRRRSAGFDLI